MSRCSNGPDGMGGAINLVTRRPTKDLEAEVRGTLTLGRSGEYQGYNISGVIGTRHDKWYAQAQLYPQRAGSLGSGRRLHPDADRGWRPPRFVRHARLAGECQSRLHAQRHRRICAELHAPGRRQARAAEHGRSAHQLSGQRFWTWPEWNTDSLYFLSTTALPDGAVLKTRLFRNSFYNMLRSFDNRNLNTQTLGRAFNSPYWDHAWGGSAELSLKPFTTDSLAFSFHYRRDKHVEAQQSFPSGATEPRQEDLEDTFSLAAENKLALTPNLTFTAGVGLDWRALHKAEEYGAPLGTNPSTTPSRLYSYPLANSQIWNGQGRLDWQGQDGTALHASISSRGRFPTIFERFSQRFGTSIPNPGLKPERATNYEIGGSHMWGPLRAEGAISYSRVTNAIVNFPTLAYSCTGSTRPGACPQITLTQSRNLAHGDYYGGEISLEAKLGSTLSLGANYTYTHRKLNDPSNAAFRPLDVPTHKAFLYADWAPVARLHVIPSLDIASDRWTVTDIAPIVYYRTGNYANAGLRIDYSD
jgi:iron complex outermembrane receptor protein